MIPSKISRILVIVILCQNLVCGVSPAGYAAMISSEETCLAPFVVFQKPEFQQGFWRRSLQEAALGNLPEAGISRRGFLMGIFASGMTLLLPPHLKAEKNDIRYYVASTMAWFLPGADELMRNNELFLKSFGDPWFWESIGWEELRAGSAAEIYRNSKQELDRYAETFSGFSLQNGDYFSLLISVVRQENWKSRLRRIWNERREREFRVQIGDFLINTGLAMQETGAEIDLDDFTRADFWRERVKLPEAQVKTAAELTRTAFEEVITKIETEYSGKFFVHQIIRVAGVYLLNGDWEQILGSISREDLEQPRQYLEELPDFNRIKKRVITASVSAKGATAIIQTPSFSRRAFFKYLPFRKKRLDEKRFIQPETSI